MAPDGQDDNPGSESRPWKTLKKATEVSSAGDTVLVRAGTYGERLIPRNSGRPGRYVVFAAFPGDEVIIDGSGMRLPEWESGLVDITDLSYIRISGFRIINAGPHDNNAGIYIDNSNHIVIENNRTYNTASSGIGVWNSQDVTIDDNEVQLACNDGEQECITVAGTSRFEISNNHVHQGGPGTKGGEGIDAKDGSSNGRIHGNVIHHMTGDRTGIYLDAWDKHTYDIAVYQNTIYECGAGISLASEMGGLLENVTIFNNIVYDNRSNGLEIGGWGEQGVRSRPVRNVKFLNNTVCFNGGDSWGGGFHVENLDARGIVIRNNIFSQNFLFQISNEAALSRRDLVVEYNLIDGYRKYNDELLGESAIEGHALFVDALGEMTPGVDSRGEMTPERDFHLQAASPAVDNASPKEAPADDFDGNPRPQGSGFDMGAFEHGTVRSAPGS